MSQGKEHEFVFSLPEMPLLSFSAFQAMRLSGDLCDVTFDVRGKKILGHRVILAANVPYFGEMFLCNYVTNEQREIIFEAMEPHAFESLIDYAYTNEIKINIDNAKSLLIGATLLRMNDICNACTTFISSRLHPANALEIKNFASAKSLVALKEAAEQYVLKHFVEISHSEEFLDVSFSDLKQLISKDELHVLSEEEVFQAVIVWVKKLPSDREDKLPQLLSIVRMPLLSYHYLSTFVANEELIKKSAYCVNLVNEAKAYRTDRMSSHSNLSVGHRNFTMDSYTSINNSTCSKENNCMYVLCRLKGKEAHPTVVACYNLMTAEWKMMNARTTFVEEAAVAMVGKKLFVIGGCNSIGRSLDAVQVFDTESDLWSFVEPFPSKISQAAAVVCSGKIYVFGGKTDDEITKYVYCYSPETKWKYLGKMYHARRAACAVTLNDCVYILGGYDDKEYRKSVEMYNPTTGVWKKLSPLDTELSCSFSATFSTYNRIYVCGNGYVQFYDDDLKEWDNICKVPKSNIVGMSIMAFGERLYIIGGKVEGRSHDENYVYIYDLEIDRWTDGKALPPNVHFISAVATAEM